jgi:hypothetical protein
LEDEDPSPGTGPAAADPGPESGPTADPGPESGASPSLDDIHRAWPAVVQKLVETAPALAATFEGARPIAFGEDGLVIGFPPENSFNKRKAESPERREAVAAAFEEILGRALRPSYELLEGEAAPDTPAPGSDEVDEKELLERLKSEFDAEEVG